ncbi:homocitrate synthase [Candidatus Desantisbacteria bacterium CG2_30_40_21]|uniref:Homocitrate synthase n=5 Tax=unclassified Candidatus Desantisiibacteriota TaxID=3106372 RepID=A0A2M7JCB4_9BACT|nr:MAG: homocitrate synthase [Candidatus Desantisbacteria bacterium CG2_30_40_21]PIP39840.1 MAG: homocitrate synthase [Candidatus Desantisbacteria bacterium CG23_combo_of_CG06-09_8_20_14_all_40_23]PIX17070.1 MAG: homocitrate synthase [Candidatus Desantisbacteria bacterium CG_4_8_14_3_um_filter_40_12]PIY18658.1 MAG: homocitrate synthase [Candidatus Desantisbacteria bacterium CG_4_10_14_3_um_filter_40_18]PJB28083.1 MAG: homocitrate synthase [Candidatus Desantisbacteria bacterium CG_4_9_14_3_um_fi
MSKKNVSIDGQKQNKIYLLDVTNRDGVQTSRLGLAKLQKTMLNLYFNEMGIFQSEFGFPTTHHEENYLNANVELAEMGVLSPIILSGWCRAIKEDIDYCLQQTTVRHLNISISTSVQMTKGKFGDRMVRSPKDDPSKPNLIDKMVEALKRAKDGGIQTIGVNAEDASRTDMEFLIEFAQAAKENGADRIRYCDTLGYEDPFTTYERIHQLASEIQIPIEMHFHNDLGMAVACSVAGAKGAIDAGVDAYINVTINGMGERAGNADLVGVILALKYSSGFEKTKYILDEGVKLSCAWKVSRYASYAFRVPIPINQIGVGANAFAHESGIHADGALKNSRNYELYDFEELGRGEPEIIETGRQITVGEYSGIKGFRNISDKLEIEFKDEKEAHKVLELVRYANVHTQQPLTVDELKFIAKYPDMTRKIMTMAPLVIINRRFL